MSVRIEEDRTPDRRWCIFDCPMRPGHECKVMLKPWPISDNKTWEMTGSEQEPTLSPSINCNGPGGCGWHGFIKHGKLVLA